MNVAKSHMSVVLARRTISQKVNRHAREKSLKVNSSDGINRFSSYAKGQVPVFTRVLAISTICRRWPGLAWSQIDQMASGSDGSRINRLATSVWSADATASRVSWV